MNMISFLSPIDESARSLKWQIKSLYSSCVRNSGTVFSIFGYWYTGGDIFRYDPVKRQKKANCANCGVCWLGGRTYCITHARKVSRSAQVVCQSRL
jgi:hypothetical protein